MKLEIILGLDYKMKKKWCTDEQIVRMLIKYDGGWSTYDICSEHGALVKQPITTGVVKSRENGKINYVNFLGESYKMIR